MTQLYKHFFKTLWPLKLLMCFELLSIQSMAQLAPDLKASQMINLGCDCSKQKTKSASSQDFKFIFWDASNHMII